MALIHPCLLMTVQSYPQLLCQVGSHQPHPKEPPPRRASAKRRAWGGSRRFFCPLGGGVTVINRALSNNSSSCQGRGDNGVNYMFLKSLTQKSVFFLKSPTSKLVSTSISPARIWNIWISISHIKKGDPKMHWFPTTVTLSLIIMEVTNCYFIER